MSSARRWLIVVLLCLGVTIAYIDRLNLSVALASADFKQAFDLSDSERGLLNSAFFWSYALLQVPAGYVVDRYGVRIPYGVSFAAWSLVSAAAAWAGSLWQLILLRVILGVGQAIVTPASLRWITLHIEERHRGLAVGILFSGSKIGPAIGAFATAQLIQSYGWRVMFVVLGLGLMVFLAPWLALVRETAKPAEARSGAPTRAFAGVWRTPVIYGILLGTIAYNYFTYFNLTWLPAYFVERWNLSLARMGFFTAFTFLGMAAMSVAGGALADMLIRRGARAVQVRKWFSMAGLLIASTEIFGSMTSSREVAVAIAMISMGGLGLTTANYWALTQTLMPSAAIGRITGLQNTASNLAGVVAPALTGWLIQTTGSYDAPMRAILVVLAAGVFGYVFLVREKYAAKQAAITERQTASR
ncbi:MAG: MFS transporter [Bryobacteraceae bacterium]|nr:MFS transporter [Bryobacteraceae bacterium]